jgi:hypothetical protein
MNNIGFIMCPHLRGSAQGVLCDAAGRYVKDMAGADIRVCMNRHYEACFMYITALLTGEAEERHPGGSPLS